MTYATSELIQLLNTHRTIYYIAWGYENLPQHTGGDLDIFVYKPDYPIIQKILEENNYKHTPCIYKKNNPSHLHDYYNKDNLTIDLFNTLCLSINGKPYQLTLTYTPTRKDNIPVNPDLELLFNLLRHYTGRKEPQIIQRIQKYLEPLK